MFVALAATAYGRFVATRNAALLADAERSHNLLENLILALVCFLCLVMTAELFLQWEPWLTPTDALWNMTPAVLWSVGMFIARQHHEEHQGEEILHFPAVCGAAAVRPTVSS